MFRVALVCLVWASLVFTYIMTPLPSATDDTGAVWRCVGVLVGREVGRRAIRTLLYYELVSSIVQVREGAFVNA